jgi:hypothetical protein
MLWPLRNPQRQVKTITNMLKRTMNKVTVDRWILNVVLRNGSGPTRIQVEMEILVASQDVRRCARFSRIYLQPGLSPALD